MDENDGETSHNKSESTRLSITEQSRFLATVPNWIKQAKALRRQQHAATPGTIVESYSRFANYGKFHPQSAPLSYVNEKISLMYGDITELPIDVIVVPTTIDFGSGGNELNAYVHEQAGSAVTEELAQYRKTVNPKVGEAYVTSGGNLGCSNIFHVLTPEKEDPDLLREAYDSCLNSLAQGKSRTIAFPSLSAEPYPTLGIPGSHYPLIPATHLALNTIRSWLDLDENRNKIDLIILMCASDREKRIYEDLMIEYFPPDPDDDSEPELEPERGEEAEKEVVDQPKTPRTGMSRSSYQKGVRKKGKGKGAKKKTSKKKK